MRHPKPVRLKDDLLLQEYRAGVCTVCLSNEVDPCHIRSRGSGGPDAEFNLIRMCRKHHSEQHQIGWLKMIAKYHPLLMVALMAKGWRLDREQGLTHKSLQRGE